MRAIPRAVATLVVVALTAVLAACEPPAPDVARERAAAWLVNQFGTDGVIPASFDPSLDDLGGTAYAVTNLTAAGTGRATARQAVRALAARVDEYAVDRNGDDLPGSLARLVLAAEAVGADPRDFGGTNLVARLQATMLRRGPDRGRFGVQSPTFDGAFRQGLALAALSLVRPTPRLVHPGDGQSVEDLPAVAWLVAQQCDDGSWMSYRADLSEPCAFDPSTFVGPDTNSTALAALGLEAVDAVPGVDPEDWFTAVRGDDGGWSFLGGADTSSDPDSTGLVIGALRALGQRPDEAALAKLQSFQFGPDADPGDRGAFWFPPFDASPPTPSLLATNDALLGLAPGVWPGVVER